MNGHSEPSLEDCLAYAVLGDYEEWLGTPSPACLQAFLIGAMTRAELTGRSLPSWRIYGPLELPEFYLPLVARTGHPTLSIKWATAMDIHHFSQPESMRELRELIRSWVERHGFATKDDGVCGYGYAVDRTDPETGLRELLRQLARRPGMFLGECSGWALRCFLAGMDRGGNWLELPTLPGLRNIIDGIEQHSEDSYGSKFAAYRVYERSPDALLAWVGIEPA